MTLRLHVTGTISYGRLHQFLAKIERFVSYRRQKGYCVPQVFLGLSGGMNTVLMVFDYASANDWEREEAAVSADAAYGRIAAEMPYLEPSIHYELFQPLEDLNPASAGSARRPGNSADEDLASLVLAAVLLLAVGAAHVIHRLRPLPERPELHEFVKAFDDVGSGTGNRTRVSRLRIWRPSP